MRYLTLEEILWLHYRVIKDYGGSHGIRDENRIKSIVDAPKQSVFGQEQYPTVFDKAAVYMRNIIADHAFVDGNKRTAVTTASIFLMRNGRKVTCTPKQLEDFAVKVAVEKLEVTIIAHWLKTHTTSAV